MITVNARYFGILTELTGLNEERIRLKAEDLVQLRREMEEKYPGMEQEEHRIAINGSIVPEEYKMKGDEREIAFLPPFSGG